ncbi:unnamed protein product, partial [Timema podura]|nr:unnamed protein product [Timema podura]
MKNEQVNCLTKAQDGVYGVSPQVIYTEREAAAVSDDSANICRKGESTLQKPQLLELLLIYLGISSFVLLRLSSISFLDSTLQRKILKAPGIDPGTSGYVAMISDHGRDSTLQRKILKAPGIDPGTSGYVAMISDHGR